MVVYCWLAQGNKVLRCSLFLNKWLHVGTKLYADYLLMKLVVLQGKMLLNSATVSNADSVDRTAFHISGI